MMPQNPKTILAKTSLALLAILVGAIPAVFAGEVTFKNEFTFYGDNTEFFEPFRLRETILGQQFKSFLDAETGDHTNLQAGLFADHRSAEDTTTEVKPIFSFRFHDNDTIGVFGTLQTISR